MRLKEQSRADKIVVALVVGGMFTILGLGLLRRPSIEGGEAPDFALSLYGGGKLSSADLRGRWLVLNFWASWCAPCREELPVLEKAWRAYRGQGVAFVGVNVKDVAKKAQDLIAEYDITYANGYDSYGKLWRIYQLTGVPETFFITPEGLVAKRHIGPITEETLRATLDALLATSGGGHE